VNTGWTTKPLLPLYIRYVQSDHSLAWKSIPSPKAWDHSHTFVSYFCRTSPLSQ
jgi:hypothetical protein